VCGLTQAIVYGGEGYFPNGGHPVAFLFLTVAPSRVDFNIHPAKKEARFQDYSAIHHAVSSAVGSFYRQHTVASLLKEKYDPGLTRPLDFQRGESDGNLKQQSGIQSEYGNRQDGYGSAFRQIAATAAVPYSAGGHIIPPPAAMGTSFADEAWESISYAAATGSVAQGTAPVASETAPYMQNPPDIPPADFKLLGQVAGTFIAVEKNDALYLIDQHAAHERIIFEQLQHNIGGVQELLIPYRIITSSEEDDAFIRKHRELLCKAGFALTDEGAGVWQVTAVPARWTGTERDLIRDITGVRKNAGDILYQILASAACRAACKDHAILDPVTQQRIAAQAFELPEPLCPHGRPIWIVLTREELFKRVKRT